MKVKKACVHIIIVLGIFCSNSQSKAQTFIWDAGFNGFFDNREYYNDYSIPQTMFGVRTYGSAGLAVHEFYSFSVGLDLLYEFGSEIDKSSLVPLIYFRFHKNPALFLLGSFHRRNLIDMPNVLQSDTILYYRPNCEGIFIELRKQWGFHNVWLDWTSRQTETNREVFVIGASGMLKSSFLFYRQDLIMTHYALSKEPDSDDHIRDNGGLYVRAGVFHPKPVFLDSLSFSAGYTMSYDRLRNVYDYDIRNGSISELYIQYKDFGIHSTLYLGEGQVQMEGDALYSGKFYNRNDFFWKIFRKNRIEGKVEFSLHVLENVVDVSQSLLLNVTIHGNHKVNGNIKNPDQ